MATIHLNNNDLQSIVREAVERLCEGQWYQAELICRLPYFVSVSFSDHAIEREYERDISQKRVTENLEKVVKELISDYDKGILGPNDEIKVIDRDSCIVAVCGIKPTYSKKRIHQIVVITCYIWDGRTNVETGNFYYVNTPSIDFKEAQKWNEENQDKVVSYQEWKYGNDIKRQKNKAEKEYYWRTHPKDASREKRMGRLNQAYQRKEKAEKMNIHDNLPDGDLKAIQDYFRDMNNKRIELEPIYEIARRAVKQALQEALRERMNSELPSIIRSKKTPISQEGGIL